MLYGPWPRRGRLLRHFSFSSSFPRLFNPGGARPCQGGTHCTQWGGRGRPALTWPRRDYLAPPEEEEKRCSNGQRCVSAARGRAQLLLPRCQGGRAGEGARARSRCPRGTQPGSKRPIDQQSASAGRGLGVPHHQGMRQPTPALPGASVPCLHAQCLRPTSTDGQDRTPPGGRRDCAADHQDAGKPLRGRVPCRGELARSERNVRAAPSSVSDPSAAHEWTAYHRRCLAARDEEPTPGDAPPWPSLRSLPRYACGATHACTLGWRRDGDM